MVNSGRASHEDVLNDAKENIDYMEQTLIPILKNKSVLKMSDMRKAFAVFFNTGAIINYLSNYASDRKVSYKEREKAHGLCTKCEMLADEVLNILEEKE